MSEETDDLKSIKVYESSNTKESWHEFALKFRVIADSRGYEEVIDGTKPHLMKKNVIEIIDKDNAETKKQKMASSQTSQQERRPCDVHRGHLTKYCGNAS